MKVVNALVTSIGGPIGQGVLKGLSQMDNVRKIGTDRRKMTAGNFFCDTVYQTPPFAEPHDYIRRLKEIIEKESIDVLFPAHPQETEFYHLFLNELDIPVALPKSDVYSSLLDKEQVYQLLENKELTQYVPKYKGFSLNEELLPLKDDHFNNHSHLVIKRVKGYGALGFAIVTDREHYLKDLKNGERNVYNIEDYLAVAENKRRIALEVLNQPEYSVDVYIHQGKTVVAVPRKRTGVSSGLVLDGTVENHEELKEAASKISEAFVTDGFLNLQFMLSDDGYKLTDVNPRFCGSQVMSLGAGVNFAELFIQQELFGRPEMTEPKWGTRMLRYRDSVFVQESENKDLQQKQQLEKACYM